MPGPLTKAGCVHLRHVAEPAAHQGAQLVWKLVLSIVLKCPLHDGAEQHLPCAGLDPGAEDLY